MKNESSSLSNSGSAGAPILISPTTILRKNIIGALHMPTSILLQEYQDGEQIAGRIYIIWGKPDEIESHPTGGT